MAKQVSFWSKDPSTQTGAVIVRPDLSIVSLGYNGFPRRMRDYPDLYANRDEKYSRIVHCEMNALLQAHCSVEGCTLYTYPFISCDRCCVHMIQAGIIRMVAPKCTDPEKLIRWEAIFSKTHRYCEEAELDLVELEM